MNLLYRKEELSPLDMVVRAIGMQKVQNLRRSFMPNPFPAETPSFTYA